MKVPNYDSAGGLVNTSGAFGRIYFLSRRLQLAGLLGFALSLASCAASSQYMGISLRPGAAEPSLQSTAQRARAGDKYAQLELGIRFEDGNGVPREAARALELYRAAATDSGGTIWVYSPPVRKGDTGRVLPVKMGQPQAGLAEARRRLEALEMRQGK